MQMLRFAQHDSTIFSHLLSPLGERVARDGVLANRRGTGEGVPTRIGYLVMRGFHTDSLWMAQKRESSPCAQHRAFARAHLLDTACHASPP
jgi:hypothetical protein